MIPKFLTSQEAITGLETIRERLAGAVREKPWAEEYPELLDAHEHIPLDTTGTPTEFMPRWTAYLLGYAQARDAKHLYATRGQLLKHGVQDAIARVYDAGDTLQLLLS